MKIKRENYIIKNEVLKVFLIKYREVWGVQDSL